MYGAVDIGGTKTLVAVFDKKGSITEQIKFPTPQTYSDFVKELAATVAKLSTKDFNSVAVAAPGKINHNKGLLIVAGNLPWKNSPVRDDVEKLFKAPTVLENDAKTAALAEAKAAGKKYAKVVYVTISTGIGIGVCENGRLVTGLRDAEPGWMTIEHNGKMVPWEKFASGKALVAATGKRASELSDPKVWDTLARNIAKGLISVIAIVQPDLIVLGGGVGNYFPKFNKPLTKYLKSYENPSVPIPLIREAKHPEEAVIYGCFELAVLDEQDRHGKTAHRS